MAEEAPQPLSDTQLDGTERIRVGRRMRDDAGERTGPVKVWTTSVVDIIKFARRVSPTMKSLAIKAGRLSYTTTDGKETDVGVVQGSHILVADGPPHDDAGSVGDAYLDMATGDFYTKEG